MSPNGNCLDDNHTFTTVAYSNHCHSHTHSFIGVKLILMIWPWFVSIEYLKYTNCDIL